MLKEKVFAYLVKNGYDVQDVGGVELNPDDDFPQFAFEAKMTRQDNDSNVLCLPARVLEDNESAWKGIVETWLNTPYANAPRFNRRNAQLDELS